MSDLNKERPILNNIISIANTVLAIVALYIAISAMNKATKQFEQDALQSDKLFRIQLKQTDSLFNEQLARNDSLINQITKLQRITDKQLSTLDVTLYENKLAGRPLFQIGVTKINSVDASDSRIFAPEIRTEFSNIGNRFAYKTRLRRFVVFDNYSAVVYNADTLLMIEPQEPSAILMHPAIPVEFKDNFFYCLEIAYYDEKMRRFYVQVKYMNYRKEREFEFYLADSWENELKTAINKVLRENYSPLLGKYN